MGKKNRKKTNWRRLSLTGEEDGGAITEENERSESQFSDESNEQRQHYRYASSSNNGRPPFYPHRNRGFPGAHYHYSRTPKVVYSTDSSAPFPQAQQSADGESEMQDENYWPDDQLSYYPQYLPQFATPTLVLAPTYHPMQWQEDPHLLPDCQYYFCLTQPVPQQPPPPSTSSPPSTVDSGDNEVDGSEQLQMAPQEEHQTEDTGLSAEEYAFQAMPMQQPPPYIYPSAFLFRPYAYNTNDNYYWWNEHGPSRGRRRRRRGFIGGEGITYDRWPSRKDRSCDRLKIAPVPNSGDSTKPFAMSANDDTHTGVQLPKEATPPTNLNDPNCKNDAKAKPPFGDNPVNRSNSNELRAESMSQFPAIEPLKDDASLAPPQPQANETPDVNQTPVTKSKPLSKPVLSPGESMESHQRESPASQLGRASPSPVMQQNEILKNFVTPVERIQDEQVMLDPQFGDNSESLDNSKHSEQTEDNTLPSTSEESQTPDSSNEIQSAGLDSSFDKGSGQPEPIHESTEMPNSSTEHDIDVQQELNLNSESSETDHNRLDHPEPIHGTTEIMQIEVDTTTDLPELFTTCKTEVPPPFQTSANEVSSILTSPPTQTDIGTEIASVHGEISSSNPFKEEMERVHHTKPSPVPNADSAAMQASFPPWSKECSSNASSAPSERQHYHQLEDPMKCSKYYQLCGEVDDMADAEPSESPSNKPSVAAPGGEIIMHEAADSASECGSEDVEMLGHRYETAAEKLYKTNALSLAVEMLNSKQQLPYDKEFKPIIDGGITNPCYANTQVLEGYYGQLKRKASNGKHKRGSINGIRQDVPDSGIHTDESGDEGEFRNTIHEDDEILFSRNQNGTDAFQYQPFGRRPRAEHSPLLYLRSKGPWHGCCCTIM